MNYSIRFFFAYAGLLRGGSGFVKKAARTTSVYAGGL